MVRFPKNAKKHICGVFQFGTIYPMETQKHFQRYATFSEGCRLSPTSLKLKLLPKLSKLSQMQNKTHFQVVLVCFSQVLLNQKISRYVVSTEGESIISTFILYQFQKVPKAHFSLTLSSSEHLLTCKKRKRKSDPCRFPTDQ